MKRTAIFITTLLICTVLFANPILNSEFKFIKKEGGIYLYERWITGAKNGQVRELKSVFVAKSSVAGVVALLKNQALGTQWNKNAQSYKIIESYNPDEWINYICYDMPAFFDDQDCCLRYQVPDISTATPEILVIPFQSIRSNLFPEKQGVRRITGVRGKWIIEQQNDHLKITYLISSDRSTSVPRFIADPIIHQNLIKSMTSFKSFLEKKS